MNDGTRKFIGALAEDAFHLNTAPPIIYIAGIAYSDVPSLSELNEILKKQKKLRFIREPENKYDSNAIRIALEDGRKIGYIPRSDNAKFAERMDNGEEIYGIFYGLITSENNPDEIAVAVITSDIVFLPQIIRQQIIPEKIIEMPEAERNAIHELASYLSLLKELKGKKREEIGSHSEIHEINRKLHSAELIDRNYRNTAEEIMQFTRGMSWEEKMEYADYAETKALLTYLLRKDHFSVCILEDGTCDSIFPIQIKEGDFIPVIERLILFAEGK